MTSLPPNADELVSAYLDGEATPDEIAIVESSPELQTRIESMRSLTGLLNAPMVAPQEQKDRHIGAALDLFDELFSSDADQSVAENETPPALTLVDNAVPAENQPSEDSAVVSLATARDKRSRRRFSPAAIAAAVAMLLFVGVTALSIGGSRSDNVATSADSAESVLATSASESSAMEDDAIDAMADSEAMDDEEAMADDDAMAEEDAMADDDAMAEEDAMADADDAPERVRDAAAEGEVAGSAQLDQAGDALGDAVASPDSLNEFFLGAYGSSEALVTDLERAPESSFRLILPEGLFPITCQAQIPELATIARSTLTGTANLGNQPVEIHRLSEDDEPLQLLIVAAESCELVTTVP